MKILRKNNVLNFLDSLQKSAQNTQKTAKFLIIKIHHKQINPTHISSGRGYIGDIEDIQLLNLIFAWGYVVRIAYQENHESMLRELFIRYLKSEAKKACCYFPEN